MMSGEVIERPNVLVVEGNDDKQFFLALLQHLNISSVWIKWLEGEDKLEDQLKALKITSGFPYVENLGIVRDADGNAKGAFDSVCSALANAALPVPQDPSGFVGDQPRVGVMIMPPDPAMGSNYALEDLILTAVKDDPVIPCVNGYFECVQQRGIVPKPEHLSKAQARVFMEAHYQATVHTFIAAKM
jgi:hypothetical protein